MADAKYSSRAQLTLWEALKDFGWPSLSLISIGGGLSIIDIAERVVFDGLTLITPFQIVLDGYHRVTDLLGAIVEPQLRAFVDWLNDQFNWHVQLQPLWRSLFVLGMVLVIGLVRTSWRSGAWGRSILSLIVLGLGAFAGAVMVGLLPLAGGWWAQGLAAGAPLALLMLAMGTATAIYDLSRGTLAGRSYFLGAVQIAAVLGVSAFALGAGLSFLPGLAGGAGVLILCGGVALLGAVLLFTGLRDADRSNSRTGLSMLGGFVAAGLILLSNWVMLVLGAPA
jgi:hypothetical protein